ncbi:MAG TPA: hypothetical protein V6C88_17195 [Chroococcidiopsis sp.]
MTTPPSALDTSFYFDERLREVANTPDDMRQAVKQLQAELSDSSVHDSSTHNSSADGNSVHDSSSHDNSANGNSAEDLAHQVRLYGLLGVYSRILGNLSQAQAALTRAIALSQELGDERLKTLNQLRLANVYQWQHKYSLCDRLFVDLVSRCIGEPPLELFLDGVYFQMGQSKFDQERYQEAQRYFERSLSIRTERGDRNLIQIGQYALNITRKRLRQVAAAEKASASFKAPKRYSDRSPLSTRTA